MKSFVALLFFASCVFSRHIVKKEEHTAIISYSCETIVDYVRNNTEFELDDFSEQFGDMCEREGEHACADIKKKVHQINGMTHLLGEASNNHICATLFPNATFTNITYSVNSSIPCIACKTVVDVIEFDINVLKFSSTKIKQIIEGLCEVLAPLKVQREVCDDIVNYIDDIIQWVLNGTSPGNICQRITLCTDTTTKATLVGEGDWKDGDDYGDDHHHDDDRDEDFDYYVNEDEDGEKDSEEVVYGHDHNDDEHDEYNNGDGDDRDHLDDGDYEHDGGDKHGEYNGDEKYIKEDEYEVNGNSNSTTNATVINDNDGSNKEYDGHEEDKDGHSVYKQAKDDIIHWQTTVPEKDNTDSGGHILSDLEGIEETEQDRIKNWSNNLFVNK